MFKEDEISMPLMDPEDYFMRGWSLDIISRSKFDLEVSMPILMRKYRHITLVIGTGDRLL